MTSDAKTKSEKKTKWSGATRVLPLALLMVIGVVLAYATTRPDSMHVVRKATIQAPPDRIFPLISDFHNWAAWSPYERMDPQMKKAYSGAQSGKGAVYEWAGNSDVGEGRMEIIDAAPPTRVTIKLDFITPFEAHNVAEFLLAPDGSGTTVSWSTEGPSAYMTKLMGIFMNMDDMIGRDFEAGLANLKTIAEQ